MPPHVADLTINETYCETFDFSTWCTSSGPPTRECIERIDEVVGMFLGDDNWNELRRSYGGLLLRATERPHARPASKRACENLAARRSAATYPPRDEPAVPLIVTGQVSAVASLVPEYPDCICLRGGGHFFVRMAGRQSPAMVQLPFEFTMEPSAYALGKLLTDSDPRLRIRVVISPLFLPSAGVANPGRGAEFLIRLRRHDNEGVETTSVASDQDADGWLGINYAVAHPVVPETASDDKAFSWLFFDGRPSGYWKVQKNQLADWLLARRGKRAALGTCPNSLCIEDANERPE